MLILSGLFMSFELLNINKYISRYLSLVPLFFLFVLIGFNRMSRDYLAYEFAFIDTTFRQSLESGYAFIVETIDRLGGDHSTIVFLSALLFLCILLKLSRTSSYVNLVIFFYCGSILIYDITQTRNFLMYLLVIVSLYFVIKGKPIKHYLFLFIATLMHKLALIYVPFYFFCKIDKKKFEKVMLFIAILLIVSSPLIIMLMKVLFPAEMSSYLKRTPGMGVLINYTYVIMDLFTVWWINQKISSKVIEKEHRKLEVFYRFSWFPILIIPFSHYFLEVIRIQRNSLLIKYIFVALAMKYLTIKQRVVAVVMLLISTIVYFCVLKYTDQWDLVEYLDENYIRYYIDKLFQY